MNEHFDHEHFDHELLRRCHNKLRYQLKFNSYLQTKKSIYRNLGISLEAKGLYGFITSLNEDELDLYFLQDVLNISSSKLSKLLKEIDTEVEE